MKVYVLYFIAYEYTHIEGVYSSLEAAKAQIDPAEFSDGASWTPDEEDTETWFVQGRKANSNEDVSIEAYEVEGESNV